jgi:phosphatidylglycerophosphate synthase
VQGVLAIPSSETFRKNGDAAAVLMQEVAGVPLLVRVLATAARAGVDSVLVIWPHDMDSAVLTAVAESPELNGMRVDKLSWTDGWTNAFNPQSTAAWASLSPCLENVFVWLPWNWVTHKRALKDLAPSAAFPLSWRFPVVREKRAVLRPASFLVDCGSQPQGVSITSPAFIQEAERFLAVNSGKPTDGIYSSFNRLLCRPAVRLLAHTRVTPNAITLGGLLVAIVGAFLFTRGTYVNYVAGAVLFFLSGLFDEMDGMVARIKFRESAFGTWFEGFVDNATYLAIFSGIVVGLYRRYGNWALKYGIALIVGCVVSTAVIAMQRRLATAADRPHEYAGKMNGLLEADSSNLLSRIARQLNMFVRKGIFIHYLLLFTFLGALPVFLWLAALGSNLTWIGTLYFTRRFFRRGHLETAAAAIKKAA